MTFSVVQVEGDTRRKVIGTLWASDEAGARAVAPSLLGMSGENVRIERSEEREIPLKVHDSDLGRVM